MRRYTAVFVVVAIASATLFGGEVIRAPDSGFQIAMTIDGASAGTVRTREGGEPRGMVVTVSLPDGKPTKHIGSITYDPLVVQVPLPLSETFVRVIGDLVANRSARRTITLVEYDFAGAVTRLDQLRAVLSEVHFPAVDGRTTEALQVKLVFEVEESSAGKDPGIGIRTATTTLAANSFSFSLAGIDAKGVMRIEPFSIVQRWTTDPTGAQRVPTKVPEPPQFSNLVLTLSGTTAAAWQKWFDEFVIRGNNGQEAEKAAVLSFAGSDFSLNFSQVGIVRVSRLPGAATTVSHQSELYFEQLAIGGASSTAQAKSSVAGSAPSGGEVRDLGGKIESPTGPTATVGDKPIAADAGVPERQVQSAISAATTSPTNPADTGTRDPAEFPRISGLTRTYYSGSFFENYTAEQAYYTSPETIYELASRTAAAAKADGWTLRQQSEDSSASGKSVSTSWARAKTTASLNFLEQRAGGTRLQVTVSVQLK